MKYSSFSFLFMLVSIYSFAQSKTASADYLKINRPAIVNDIPYSEKIVKDAIDNKMEQIGVKGKDTKGYVAYKGVKTTELGAEIYDLYFKVDRKSRKDKDNSTVTLLISKGHENFVDETSDANLINNAKKYLDNIKDVVTAFDLNNQITAQEDEVKKADKKYNNLVDDGQSLDKKLKNIQKDIEENKNDQAKQKAETDKQKQILDALRSKRKQ